MLELLGSANVKENSNGQTAKCDQARKSVLLVFFKGNCSEV